MAFAVRCIAYAFAQRQRQRCSLSYTIPQPQRQRCMHPKAAISALGTAPAALLATATIAYHEMMTTTQPQLQALLQLLQRRPRSFCRSTASATTLRSAAPSVSVPATAPASASAACSLRICRSHVFKFSCSDMPYALMLRHVGSATAFCNQQHPSNMLQQFNISALQQQQSFVSSAYASVSAFSNAPALQLQLLQ